MKTLFSKIWNDHPLIGLGLGQNDVADSQWFQVFGSGGLLGLILIVVFTFVLIKKALEYGIKDTKEGKLFVSLVILSVIAGIGAPVYTLNRSSGVLWALLSILLVYKKDSVNRKKDHQHLQHENTIAISKKALPN